MSRELKFRAWHKDNYIELSDLRGNKSIYFIPYALGFITQSINRKEVVLEQYTGLKDKNGKEIYEGDIVVWSGQKYAIRWHEGAHGVWQNNIQHFYVISAGIAKSCEIIGNIHENPELLEKK